MRNISFILLLQVALMIFYNNDNIFSSYISGGIIQLFEGRSDGHLSWLILILVQGLSADFD